MSFVLDLTRGQARVRQVVFNRGQPRPTVSIGRAAAWSLVADDLEDVHAFVSFDGAALMVRSAEEHNPAWLDGRAVPCAWTPVGRASILALGNARITVTAKEDHARPGRDDDDEVTGQIELRPAAGSGVTAVSRPPAAAAPDDPGDDADGEQGVTGDEPTGEMTGARAPQRGLLPRPRVPPRASAGMRAAPPAAPPRLEVPDFDEATQLRWKGPTPAAGGRPAPLPVTTDDEERTQALDLHAMQAAQRPAARPVRPNIAIAPDTDEATRMLAREQPMASPAGRLVPGPRLAGGLAATVPAPPVDERLAEPARERPDTVPPPSGATQLRPMVAAPLRAPGSHVSVPPGAKTLIDPFATTGGSEVAQAPGPAPLTGLAALPPIPAAIPPAGTADVTGMSRALSDGNLPGQPGAEPAKPKSKAKKWGTIAYGVVMVTGLGLYAGYTYFGLFHPHPAGPQNRGNTPVTAPPPASGSVPLVAASDVDAAATPMIGQNRSTLPLPELPHKGPIDAGAPDADTTSLDGGVTTMQRAAADAIAEGDLARASLYYDRLAELAPNVGAHSAASRILKAQMAADAGGRRF